MHLDIFHEVRVPLNSALLAFQNLQANSVFKYCEVEQGVEIHAREATLDFYNTSLQLSYPGFF